MRVLLIQSNAAEAGRTLAAFKTAGFATDHAEDAAVAFAYLREYPYDIAVLDRALPDMEGCLAIRRMRTQKIETPVLMLTPGGTPAVTVTALRAGADDVLAGTLDREELVARMETIVRRCHGHGESILEVGPMRIDMGAREVLIHGRPLTVTRKEFAVLQLLALRRGKAATKQAIINGVYDGMSLPGPRVIDVFVCNLRRKLAALGAGDLIETVRGGGYIIRLDGPAAKPAHRDIAA
jgi:two-component system cell cycle response regulator CtrA